MGGRGGGQIDPQRKKISMVSEIMKIINEKETQKQNKKCLFWSNFIINFS